MLFAFQENSLNFLDQKILTKFGFSWFDESFINILKREEKAENFVLNPTELVRARASKLERNG